jgi:hypothetical protein
MTTEELHAIRCARPDTWTGEEVACFAGARDSLVPGMELKVKRRVYWHYGIYVGKRRVIHYAGWFHSSHGLIEEVSLEQFTEGRPFSIGRRPTDPSNGEEIVRRARSRLGEQCYDLLRNNCEHFCNWCHVGEPRSAQVETLLFYPLLQGVRSRVRSRPPAHAGQTVMA